MEERHVLLLAAIVAEKVSHFISFSEVVEKKQATRGKYWKWSLSSLFFPG